MDGSVKVAVDLPVARDALGQVMRIDPSNRVRLLAAEAPSVP